MNRFSHSEAGHSLVQLLSCNVFSSHDDISTLFYHLSYEVQGIKYLLYTLHCITVGNPMSRPLEAAHFYIAVTFDTVDGIFTWQVVCQ